LACAHNPTGVRNRTMDTEKTSVSSYLSTYKALSDEIYEAEKPINALKDKRIELAKGLYTNHGRGPFQFDGDSYVITVSKADPTRVSLTKIPPKKKKTQDPESTT
jgi:hypothetical protein